MNHEPFTQHLMALENGETVVVNEYRYTNDVSNMRSAVKEKLITSFATAQYGLPVRKLNEETYVMVKSNQILKPLSHVPAS